MAEHHHMRAIYKWRGGAEWKCDTCGRQIVVAFHPAIKKIVKVRGDETAYHHADVRDEPQLVSSKEKPPSAFREWFGL